MVIMQATGSSPQDAGEKAIARIQKFYPDFAGALVVANAAGEHAGACSKGLGKTWSYSYVAAQALCVAGWA